MAGELAFTLGLENKQFLDAIGVSESVLVGFELVAEGLKAVFEKCWEAIEKGAALQALHARTGESVGSLYQLQQAFKAVEIDAGAVGGMLFKTEKFLGGVTEEGEKIDEILARLGLSLTTLQALGPTKTFTAVGAALAKLDTASAANIAAKLYGREGAGNMIQIARSGKEFREAMAAAAEDAQIWQDAAPAFHQIVMYAGMIQVHLSTLWAGIAQGAAPAIMKIEKALEKINFGAIGKNIGQVIDAVANIIADGKLGKLLELTLSAAIQETSNFFLAVIVGWEAALGQVAIHFGTDLLSAIINAVRGSIPVLGFIGAYILNPAIIGPQIDAMFAAITKTAANANPFQAFATAFAAVEKSMPHDLAKQLADLIKHYRTATPPAEAEPAKKAPDNGLNTQGDKPRTTDLEKIGYVIASGGTRNEMVDAVNRAAATAQAQRDRQLQAQYETNLHLAQLRAARAWANAD